MMIKQLIPNKICLTCFGCCRFDQKNSAWAPRLLKEEEKLLGKIKLTFDPKAKFFSCSFFDPKKNKCRVYRRRPFECRLYPFLLCRKENKVFLSIDLNCSCAGGNFKNKKFKEYAEYLIRLLKSKKFLKTLENNPQIAQAYPQVTSIYEIM